MFLQSEIFKALEKTWLAVGDKKELQYSRCGRTDKGVSSVGQVCWFQMLPFFLFISAIAMFKIAQNFQNYLF